MIPNGFDTDLFAPDAAARAEVRREIGVGDGVPLVGLVGRLHPMKDHATFLAAAAVVLRSHPAAHFVLVGRGVPESERLQEQVGALGLRDHVHFQGERHDVPRVFAALDVAVCSSYSEAFPNVVAEAMACGTPVVTTNAGDAASIVGNVGRIVPPRHPELLAAAVLELLAMTATSREALGLAGRARIVERYSLSSAASRYQSLYRELARRAKSRRRLVCAG
jgi:glycosyltransferase involved in cell wall biosynthesis